MVAVGAGHVERNIVVSIIILPRVKNYLQQKTVMMLLAVNKKKVLRKKTIAAVVIRAIVHRDGNKSISKVRWRRVVSIRPSWVEFLVMDLRS